MVETSVTHVSCVFHFLTMQTQTLKDVSTAWQVWSKTSSFDSTHIKSSLYLIWAWCGVCRTGDISWLIDKGSQWLDVWWCQRKVNTESSLIWTHVVLRQWAEHGRTNSVSLWMPVKPGFGPKGHFYGTKYLTFFFILFYFSTTNSVVCWQLCKVPQWCNTESPCVLLKKATSCKGHKAGAGVLYKRH